MLRSEQSPPFGMALRFGPAPQPMSRKSQTAAHAGPADVSGGIPNSLPTSNSHRRYLFGVVGIIAAVVVVTTLTLRHEHQKQLVYWQERLSRIAEANQRLLNSWVRERSDDARLLAGFPFVGIALRSGTGGHPLRPPLWQQRLQDELNSVAGTYSYAGAYVLNRNGRMLAQSDASPPLNTGVVKELKSNPQTGSGARAITIPAADGRADYPQVAFVAPIRQGEQLSAKVEVANTVGYVVLLTHPEAIGSLLFP